MHDLTRADIKALLERRLGQAMAGQSTMITTGIFLTHFGSIAVAKAWAEVRGVELQRVPLGYRFRVKENHK